MSSFIFGHFSSSSYKSPPCDVRCLLFCVFISLNYLLRSEPTFYIKYISPIHPYIPPSIHPSLPPSLHLSVFPFLHQSIHLSIHTSLPLSLHASVCPLLPPSIYAQVSVGICLLVPPSPSPPCNVQCPLFSALTSSHSISVSADIS